MTEATVYDAVRFETKAGLLCLGWGLRKLLILSYNHKEAQL